VEDGEEYEAIVQSLIRQLAKVTIPGSQQPFVRRAYRRDELYHGPHTADFPDIILLPSDMRYSDSGVEFFSNDPFSELDANSGSHRMSGTFVIWGTKVHGGQKLDGIHIRDIMPTALHLLGQPIPDDVDGRVLTEALDPAWLQTNPVCIGPATGPADPPELAAWSSGEEDEIRKRLAGLGYLDG
jgi:predicted AlkP superfamily phosphohydrolase/phosphomutase